MRKYPAVPFPDALRVCHVPAKFAAPPDAAAIQVDGRLMDASRVPVEESAQVAGADPVRISKTGAEPPAVAMALTMPFRAVVEN
jgi:hypothetical protein